MRDNLESLKQRLIKVEEERRNDILNENLQIRKDNEDEMKIHSLYEKRERERTLTLKERLIA